MNPTPLLSLLLLSILPAVAADTAPAKPAAPAPAPVTHWEQCGWGGGGHFSGAVMDPKNDGTIYMSLDVGGVSKTTDHGMTWKIMNIGLADYGTFSLAIDRLNPQTVYAMTNSGLCKSTDGAEHWKVLPQTGPKELQLCTDGFKSIRAVAVDPTNGNNLYAASRNGTVCKSTDGGETWTVSYTPTSVDKPQPVRSVAVSAKNPSQVLAATSSGLVLSNDAGKTWTEVKGPVAATSAAFSESEPNTIYASYDKDQIYKSVDAGKTWAKSSDGLAADASVREVAVSPVNANDVYAIGSSTWISKDGAKTWKESNTMKIDLTGNPTRHSWGEKPTAPYGGASNVTINPQHPEEVFVSADWRSAWSNDGGVTWEERNRGADITCTTDIRFTPGHAYATAMDEGTLMSTDNGKTWKQLWPSTYIADLSGHYWRVAATPVNGVDHIISAGSPWNSPHYRMVGSDDGGKTKFVSTEGLPFPRPKKNTMWETGYPRALAVDPKDPQIIYLGLDGDPSPEVPAGGGLFKSTDGGKTWKQTPGQPASRRMFYGLQVDPTDSKRIYWGSCGDGGGIYRSDDGGDTWSKSLLPVPNQWVFNIHVTSDGTVYGGAQNLWKSTDHGNTWNQVTFFKEGWQIMGLESDPRHPDTVWVSRSGPGSQRLGSINKTIDGGKTWTDITGDAQWVGPQVLRFNPETNELWAGWVGIYRTKQ